MDSMQVLRELHKMPALIKSDSLSWKKYVYKGSKYARLYTATWAKIFDTESRSDNTEEQHLQRLFNSLNVMYEELMCALNALGDIQLRTQRMLYRVRLWSDDELLRKHRITWDLDTLMLLEFLEFLKLRYDYEWEVKEMVVMELQNMTTDDEGRRLVRIWQDNSHAGGAEFEDRLKTFFKLTGLGGSTFPTGSSLQPVLGNVCKCKCKCNSVAQQSESFSSEEDTSSA